MSLWGRKAFVVVRVLGRHGHYPSFEVRTPSHVFLPSELVCWSAVLQPGLPEDWELGEATVLVPEEVRLFSALSLSERDPWLNSRPIVTHWAEAYVEVNAQESDLQSVSVFSRVEEAVARLGTPPRDTSLRQREGFSNAYVVSDIGSKGDALRLLERIDTDDQLLLAGLARLLGGTRLIFAAHEMEEAALSLFVSMGAALEYLRLSLAEQLPDATISFKDVYQYLTEVYPTDSSVAEYYEYMYEHRLVATHPANRLGEFWAPPLMADDIYHLQKHLILLYRHITLGNAPEFEY
jgi:hypothetical protein